MPQPEIVVPPAVKFTVPVAPLVTVAVKVIEPPVTIDVAEDDTEILDAFPGFTKTRGLDL